MNRIVPDDKTGAAVESAADRLLRLVERHSAAAARQVMGEDIETDKAIIKVAMYECVIETLQLDFSEDRS